MKKIAVGTGMMQMVKDMDSQEREKISFSSRLSECIKRASEEPEYKLVVFAISKRFLEETDIYQQCIESVKRHDIQHNELIIGDKGHIIPFLGQMKELDNIKVFVLSDEKPFQAEEYISKLSYNALTTEMVQHTLDSIEAKEGGLYLTDNPIQRDYFHRNAGKMFSGKHQTDDRCYNNKIQKRRKKNKNKKTHRKK